MNSNRLRVSFAPLNMLNKTSEPIQTYTEGGEVGRCTAHGA